MTQTPVTVNYTLEEVLGQISQKLDRMDTKLEDLRQDVDTKFKDLRQDVVELKVGQVKLEGDIKALETEVRGIGKRLDTQEFINRSVVVGFVLALAAGVIKLFLPTIAI